MIRTPDQRLRVFVSSTLGELASERMAVRRAIERLRLSAVMFETGARPHPPRELYRAYLEQSHVFVGIYWQRYGWVAPGESVSGLEDEYRLAGSLPQLLYIKEPAPHREDALQALLREIKASDQTSYRRFRRIEELEELVAEDLAMLLSERFESASPVGPHRHAPLPQLLTPTIGREDDVARVVELLESGTRLVTITGPGGVGKTRVALEAAHARDEAATAAVYYVPLASVSDPDLVMATVADELGVREISGRRPVQTVEEFIGSSRALLVLDNLEQVIGAAPEIVSLVERAPNVRVLVTSRQPLRVRSEQEVPITPLAAPKLGATATEIENSSAVQLFVDRAKAQGVGFELTDDNAANVAELCRRLEGLPLAIELAVARLRLLSPQQLLDRLGKLLDLESGLVGLPARQHTLRATLDWSHQLLSEGERSMFARQAVFAGGATLDALEAVCGDEDVAVLDTLPGLLDHALVVADDSDAGGEPRFCMLEPVAEYARELLPERHDAEAIHRRHVDYFTGLGRQAQPFLCGPRQREWAALFDAERPNLRVVVASCLEHGEEAKALRLVWDTLVYFYIRDAIEEPRRWLLELANRRKSLDATGQALLDVGLVTVGEAPAGRDVVELLEGACPVFQGAGLDLEAAVARHHQGVHFWWAGDVERALDTLDLASRSYATLDHDWGVATIEMALGAVCAALRRYRESVEHLQKSLEHSRNIDNQPQMAQALQGLSLVEALEGRADEARSAVEEAIRIVEAEQSVTLATYCLESLAALAVGSGDASRAAELMGVARESRRRLSIPEWTAAADAAEPVITAARHELGAEEFHLAWRRGSTWEVFSALKAEASRVTSSPG